MSGKYPSTYYRVSLKAIIRNTQGEVLVVKLRTDDPAHDDKWDLPGGGMEHGESELQTFARELHEEAAISTPIASLKPIGITPVYSHRKERWWLGICYELTFDGELSYGVGEDSSEVRFIDPKSFRDSPYDTEQLIYQWSAK